MPALKNRINRLERVFVGTRSFTDDQLDGIFLLFLSQMLPEQWAAIVRTAAIYPWAAHWYAKREEERRHWSDEELEAAANRKLPQHLWDAYLRHFIKAWERQIPGVPCPLVMVDGELFGPISPEDSAVEPAR